MVPFGRECLNAESHRRSVRKQLSCQSSSDDAAIDGEKFVVPLRGENLNSGNTIEGDATRVGVAARSIARKMVHDRRFNLPGDFS